MEAPAIKMPKYVKGTHDIWPNHFPCGLEEPRGESVESRRLVRVELPDDAPYLLLGETVVHAGNGNGR